MMRAPRFVRSWLLALLLAGCAIAPPQGPVAVRLIGINDFHGNLESAGLNLVLADPAGGPALRVPAGGAAAVSGMVKRLRAGERHSLMIAAGDLIGASPLVSSLFRHESTIDILGDIGLEVSSLGNHEFDAGEPELQRVIRGGCAANKPEDPAASCAQSQYAGTRFAYIAANVTDPRGQHIVAPYVVRDFEGIPVGFIGGVTKTTPQLVSPSGIAGLTFDDEADAVNRAADELRAKGVRAMVAVFHEGIELGTAQKRGDWNDATCPEAHGPLLDIARRLAPEIKVVFSGHTHQGYRCEIGGRLLIQGTSYGRGISVVDVALDRETRTMLPPVRSYNLPVVNEHTPGELREKLAAASPQPFAAVVRESRPDEAIAARVAKLAQMVKPKADRPIGRIGGAMTRVARTDSPAGRLIADAMLAATKADGAQIALMNPGGIRTDVPCAAPPCQLTFGQAFTMQPFGNAIVVMTLTGAQLKSVLEQQDRPTGDPYLLQPSEGFTFTWQADAPRGNRVRDMRLAGEPIRPEGRYRVTVNSFLAEGGDGFTVLKGGTDLKGGGQDIDVLIAYFSGGERTPPPTPRIARLP